MSGQVHVEPGVLDSIGEWDAGDIIDFEEATGLFFSDMQSLRGVQPGQAFQAPFKLVIGLAWIAARKNDAGLTFEQAKRWKLAELQSILAPTSAAPLAKLERPVRKRSAAVSTVS